MPVSRTKAEVVLTSPRCVSSLVTSTTPSVTYHSEVYYLRRKDFYCSLHPKVCRSLLASSSPLLFLVARHSIAHEYNIFFYLFYLSLHLKSLGSPQDAKAGIFWEMRHSVQQCVLACILAMSSSHARSRPWIGAWVIA